MTRRPRRNHSPAFKGEVAVAATKGEKTLIELAQDFDVHLLPAGHVCMPERRTKSSNGAISVLKAPQACSGPRPGRMRTLRST